MSAAGNETEREAASLWSAASAWKGKQKEAAVGNGSCSLTGDLGGIG